MTKNILITGANGQDGKIILDKLRKKKFNLFLIARSFQKKVKRKNIKYFKFDLKEKKKIVNLLKNNKIDIILHLASNNPNYGQNSYQKHFVENVNNSKNLINNSIVYNDKIKFISCSSSRIFSKKNGIVNEKSSVLENDHYSKFRIAINNHLIRTKKNNKNFDFTNIILFNHDSVNRSERFLLPKIITALISKDNEFIKMIIDENISMDYSHAEDICNGIIKVTLTKKKIDKIILSSGKKTLINDVIKFLIKKNNLNMKLKFKKLKKSNCVIGNNHYAKKIINYKIKKNIFLAASEIYDSKKKS